MTYENRAKYLPKPLFDTLEHLQDLYKKAQNDIAGIDSWLLQTLTTDKEICNAFAVKDYRLILNFLYDYRGSNDTFNAYRRELERLLQWSWFIQQKSILNLKRQDIEEYIEFCQKPPNDWIATKVADRFLMKNGLRLPNPEWRPFVAKISKKAFQDGNVATKADFELSQQGLKILFAVLGSFYNYLIQENVTEINPVAQIRQKSKFLRKEQTAKQIRRLSDLQWQMVIQTANELALASPEDHERTLFIMNALYGMYLRISELVASERWMPKMSDFFRDHNNNWWFKTVGKGNKLRQIAVSESMLLALKRWRNVLGLTGLPSPDEDIPLVTKNNGSGAITNTKTIRNIVQLCFDKAVEKLKMQKQFDEAELLRSATVHWLRHTGISDDVKVRPREHVRDDAGHSSGAITDRYIDVELQARAASAKNKIINPSKK